MLDGCGRRGVRSAGSPAMTWDIPEDLPPVAADAGLLERVVANLVANAVQHAGTSADAHLVLRARTDESGAFVLLSVIDSGPGVPEGDLDRIFAPFQRLDDQGRSGGLGLGLAVARGFVDAMGGVIAASRTPGGGLTVTLRMPVTTAAARRAAARAPRTVR